MGRNLTVLLNDRRIQYVELTVVFAGVMRPGCVVFRHRPLLPCKVPPVAGAAQVQTGNHGGWGVAGCMCRPFRARVAGGWWTQGGVRLAAHLPWAGMSRPFRPLLGGGAGSADDSGKDGGWPQSSWTGIPGPGGAALRLSPGEKRCRAAFATRTPEAAFPALLAGYARGAGDGGKGVGKRGHRAVAVRVNFGRSRSLHGPGPGDL